MKRWYVVQVYTGFEEAVKADLEKQIKTDSLEDLVDKVLIPTSEIASFFCPTEENKTKKEVIFPGYLLVHMEMVGDGFRLVTSTPKVSRFLGGATPVALSEKEVDRIFSQMEGKLQITGEKSPFTVGSEVHVASGPFSGFVGMIDKVDEEKGRLTVMVSIFGRLTPVEFGFDQVKK